MRILLTNDDGIHAQGIQSLHEALSDPPGTFGRAVGETSGSTNTEIFTVAPLTVQSATGHGITFHKPLMVSSHQVAERFAGLAVDARPADCVKLAVCSLWGERFGVGSSPDLLISGMNQGANCGINVLYSGTVAAALEGAFLGIPSIAVSLHLGGGHPRYDVAARRARVVIDAILAAGIRPHECLSINIPITEADGPMPPVRCCPMNTHGLIDKFERREDPDGRAYYWPAGHGLDFRKLDPGSDVDFLVRKCITVTPLTYDLSNRATTRDWADRLSTRLPADASTPSERDPRTPLPVDEGD